MTLQTELTSLAPDALIDLYILDLTLIDSAAPVYYFYAGYGPETATTGAQAPTPGAISFGGQAFAPWGVEVSGFKSTSSGKSPRPKLRIGNKNRVMTNAAKLYGDLVGAEFTRRRTMRKFLDDGTAADSSQKVDEVYYVHSRTKDDVSVVEWDMVTGLDADDMKLPGRTMLADMCPWPYIVEDRAPDPTFECPWARSDPSKYFDAEDNPVVNKADDECGKTLKSCMLRYGERTVNFNNQIILVPNGPLPFGGMPGMRRK